LDDLIPIVEQSFKTNHEEMKFNSLYMLHLVMKTLLSKTLPMARKIAQDISPKIFNFVAQVFYDQTRMFFVSVANFGDVESLDSKVALARIALKTTRRLIPKGFQQFSNSVEVANFQTFLVQHLPKYLEALSSAQRPLANTLESLIHTAGKLFVDLSYSNAVDFILCKSFLSVLGLYWNWLQTNVLPDIPLGEKLKIQAMLIVKNVCQNRDFNIVSERNFLFLKKVIEIQD
jgi:hypothetical protein